MKFTFKSIFYINNAWVLFKKLDKLSFFVINEINIIIRFVKTLQEENGTVITQREKKR